MPDNSDMIHAPENVKSDGRAGLHSLLSLITCHRVRKKTFRIFLLLYVARRYGRQTGMASFQDPAKVCRGIGKSPCPAGNYAWIENPKKENSCTRTKGIIVCASMSGRKLRSGKFTICTLPVQRRAQGRALRRRGSGRRSLTGQLFRKTAPRSQSYPQFDRQQQLV